MQASWKGNIKMDIQDVGWEGNGLYVFGWEQRPSTGYSEHAGVSSDSIKSREFLD